MAISPSGEIVGIYGEPPQLRGFLRDRTGKFTTFDIEGMSTFAAAINASGQVAGIYSPNDVPPFKSFLRQPDGTIVTFVDPYEPDTEANVIDNRGEIAGWTTNNLGPPIRMFLRSPDGEITTFDIPDAAFLLVTATNAKGQIIGWEGDTATETQRGFLREPDGTITKFDVPLSRGIAIEPDAESVNTQVSAINDKGQIAGAYFVYCRFPVFTCNSGPHAFLRERDGSFTFFDFPNAAMTIPSGIDSKGEIAGEYIETPIGPIHGFLRKTDGSLSTLDVPNAWTLSPVITPGGQIAGTYLDKSGFHGFVVSLHNKGRDN
jgi:hypothetical protein